MAKVFTHYYINREWDLTRLVGSGGMPSSHTALVMGLTTAVGIVYTTSSPFFAIALVFSLIVSTRSRRAAVMHVDCLHRNEGLILIQTDPMVDN